MKWKKKKTKKKIANTPWILENQPACRHDGAKFRIFEKRHYSTVVCY